MAARFSQSVSRRALLVASLAAVSSTILAAYGTNDAAIPTPGSTTLPTMPALMGASSTGVIPTTAAGNTIMPTGAPLTGSPIPGNAASQVSGALIKAKLGLVVGINSSDIYLAQAKNFYRRYGIDAELITFQSATVQRDALINGDIDLSAQAPFHVYLAQSKGTPLKIVGNRRDIVDVALVVRKDLADQVKTVTDLKGRTIAASALGAWDWAVANTYAKQNGLDPQNDLRFLARGSTTAVALFKTKQVDAAAVNPPDLTDLIDNGLATYLIDPTDPAIHLKYFKAAHAMSRAWITHQRVIDEKPTVIAGVMKAADDTFQYFHSASIDEITQALLPHFGGTTPSSLSHSIANDLKVSIPTSVVMSRASYAADQQVFLDSGLVPHEIPFDSAVDGRWANVTN